MVWNSTCNIQDNSPILAGNYATQRNSYLYRHTTTAWENADWWSIRALIKSTRLESSKTSNQSAQREGAEFPFEEPNPTGSRPRDLIGLCRQHTKPHPPNTQGRARRERGGEQGCGGEGGVGKRLRPPCCRDAVKSMIDRNTDHLFYTGYHLTT